MRVNLLSRLARLEAQKRLAQPVIRFGIVRQLPRDYVGERHVVPVEPLPLGTPDTRMFGFEERPGPGPAPPSMHEGVITIYISEADAKL